MNSQELIKIPIIEDIVDYEKEILNEDTELWLLKFPMNVKKKIFKNKIFIVYQFDISQLDGQNLKLRSSPNNLKQVSYS